jgi:hypothetical protein
MGYASKYASMYDEQPYPFDPRQPFDPENIPPPPPGYGEKGGNYLLPDEVNPAPAYLPQNPDGSTSFPQQFGPPPPTFYATNVPDTAKKWGGQGQDYTFLAESPAAAKTAEGLPGDPTVMKGYDPALDQKTIGPEPKPGELDEMGQFKTFWGHYVNDKYKGRDPLTVNPSEEGMKAEEAARSKYALELMNRDPGSVDYKKYEKLITEAKTDAMKKAEWERKMGEEDQKMAHGFFQTKLTDQRRISAEERKQKGIDSLTNVDKAQKFTMNMMSGAKAPENFEMPPEDRVKALSDKTFPLDGYRLKPIALQSINRERERAGLPLIVEKPVDVPMVETRNFTPWGPKIPFTTPTASTPVTKYSYEEGPAPAPGRNGIRQPRLSTGEATQPEGPAPGSLPDPRSNKGRSGTESTTGKRYRSDGNQWLEVK